MNIYLLWFEDMGLPLYVGVTKHEIQKRRDQHSKRFLADFGRIPDVCLLEKVNDNDFDKEAWKAAERKWILFFRTLSGKFDKSSILNVNEGGNSYGEEASRKGGKHHKSTETRQRMSKPKSEVTKSRISASKTGKRYSEEYKASVSMGNKRMEELVHEIMGNEGVSYKEAKRLYSVRKASAQD